MDGIFSKFVNLLSKYKVVQTDIGKLINSQVCQFCEKLFLGPNFKPGHFNPGQNTVANECGNQMVCSHCCYLADMSSVMTIVWETDTRR